jgi:membrane-bound ClpP family serine protease
VEPVLLILASLGLALVAAMAAAAEVLFVSFGVLGAVALGCALGAILIAFQAHPLAGWALLLIAPMGIWYAIAWALRRLRSGVGAVTAELTSAGGYAQEAARLEVGPGALGEMVTDAMPTGRARFPRGELDVAAEGGALRRGDRVRVLAVEGPRVVVVRLPA